MGLVVFGAIALYLLVSVVVVIVATRQARKRGRSAWRWGGLAALAMYLLVFWDHVPTIFMHRYYCEKEAGFWVHKTVEQWKQENPGVWETLATKDPLDWTGEESKDRRERINVTLWNQRFKLVTSQKDVLTLLPIIQRDEQLIDTATNQVIARYVDFSAGNSVSNTITPPGPLKFWLQIGNCTGDPSVISNRKWMNQFLGVKP